MSIGKQVWVNCDSEGCLATTNDHDANTAGEARAIARRLGWTSTGGLDLCPEHKEAL